MIPMEATGGRLRTAVSTGFALVAFAANSLLCRLALGEATIDPASFSMVRLVSGAITLLLIGAVFAVRSSQESRGSWGSASMLFLYAVAFSLAYVELSVATGALILFSVVQVTMIIVALWLGERPHLLEWVGLLLALGGLVYLVFPGLTAPSPIGCTLMAVAGISWGIYSLLGRGTADPRAETTANFVRSVPLVVGISLIMLPNMHVSGTGVLLAVLSGAVTSGVGYVVWYMALKGLTATQAATVQLCVPVLAAVGGVMFLSEDITKRLLLSAVMILGGIGLVVGGRAYLHRVRTTG